MTSDASPPRWVVVTCPDRPGLLDELAWRYRRAPWVNVLADRRHGARRQQQEPRATDLRLGDRRRVPGDRTTRPAYRLALHGDGFDVYEATGHAAAQCPECGATVMFEMPRSGEPPTRLDVQVAHDRTAVDQHHARHVVDLLMYAFTGRPLWHRGASPGLAWR